LLVRSEALVAFLNRCREEKIGGYREVFAPVFPPDRDSPESFFAPLRGTERLALDGYRSVDPVKILFYRTRETVVPAMPDAAPRLIAGVKACDLKGLQVLDAALINKDFVDPAYSLWREQTTILSFDCTEAGPTCHCTLAGGKPFPEAGTDANASSVGGHYFLSALSEKGRALLDLIRNHVPVAQPGSKILETVEARRAEMLSKVRSLSAKFERSENYARLRQAPSEGWKGESRECVGCGACTNICPTCYCLILNDETQAGPFVKVRSYDSCQWNGYARVASGASPRPRMDERFRNRYLCKLVLMKDQFGLLGCTGCGRCTDACPAGIEFPGVVRRLMEAAAVLAAAST
jgi:sulfhydrogenase subunit beta (sulfur reductase)